MTTVFFATSSLLFAVAFMIGGRPGMHNKILPSFESATKWFNSQPLNLEELRGKVVLVDFWTYTCVNWRRTLPYIRDWASKYKERGLVVVGVHTPEFSFEHQFDHVTTALGAMQIDYPVVIDNDYGIWTSFQNQYWPALYLIDNKGKIRFTKFGEGDYRQIELQIQQLLLEVQPNRSPLEVSALRPTGFEAAADWQQLGSGENYLGYGRTEGFASPGGLVDDSRKVYAAPGQIQLNQWGLSGEWMAGKDRILSTQAGGKVIYRFHARDLNLIMGIAKAGAAARFRVRIGGVAPGVAHGLDTDSAGNGTVGEPRMYQLIRQDGHVSDQTVEIEFLDAGVEVYDVTFG